MKKFFAAIFAVLVVSLSAASVLTQGSLTGPPPMAIAHFRFG